MRDASQADPRANIPDSASPDTLVDIRSISVDPSLPREERIAEFVRQIGNPYQSRCGKTTIHTSFAEGGPSLEACLTAILG